MEVAAMIVMGLVAGCVVGYMAGNVVRKIGTSFPPARRRGRDGSDWPPVRERAPNG